MKIFLLTLIALICVVPAPAQSPVNDKLQSLDETIISESFDAGQNGSLPLGWTQVSLDTGRTSDAFYGTFTVWQKASRVGVSTHTGPGVCVVPYNSNRTPNDDWLILPRIDSLIAPINFSYWTSSQDAQFLESFEVKVSITGSQPADFTHLVESVTDAPHLWTQHALSLSAYARAPFWIAFHYNSTDEFLLKVDDVLLTGTRVSAEDPRSLAASFSFEGNYPNPFNSETRFRFTLAQPGRVGLTIYDLLGREVACPTDYFLTPGTHDIAFDAKDLPSGTYLVRLTPPFGAATRKMILLK